MFLTTEPKLQPLFIDFLETKVMMIYTTHTRFFVLGNALSPKLSSAPLLTLGIPLLPWATPLLTLSYPSADPGLPLC